MGDGIRVLELVDPTGEVLAIRLTGSDGTITWGSPVVVREGQTALFYRDGRCLASFAPGRHVLETQNLPVLEKLAGKLTGGESPFKAEVFLVAGQLATNLRWGTLEPFFIPDPVLVQIPVRAHGRFAIRVSEPELFVPKVVGTRPVFRARDLEDFLRGQYLVPALTDALASLDRPWNELPRYLRELGIGVKSVLSPEFAALGLELTDLSVASVSTTEEIQGALTRAAALASEAHAKARGTRYELEAKAAGAAALEKAGTSYREVGTTDALKTLAESSADGSGAVTQGVGLGVTMLVPGLLADALKGGAKPPDAAPAVDPLVRLKQLKELLDAGALTASEFEAKKAELLKRV